MSMFESDRYEWRETYFVLFRSENLPSVERIESTLRSLSGHYQVTSVRADDDGQFESATLVSPGDFAALDISYLSGEEVLEQGASLARDIRPADPSDADRLSELPRCDARFDVMHFEQIVEAAEEEEPDEMLDPSALLAVLEALVKLTDGVGIDPQSGSLV